MNIHSMFIQSSYNHMAAFYIISVFSVKEGKWEKLVHEFSLYFSSYINFMTNKIYC